MVFLIALEAESICGSHETRAEEEVSPHQSSEAGKEKVNER